MVRQGSLAAAKIVDQFGDAAVVPGVLVPIGWLERDDAVWRVRECPPLMQLSCTWAVHGGYVWLAPDAIVPVDDALDDPVDDTDPVERVMVPGVSDCADPLAGFDPSWMDRPGIARLLGMVSGDVPLWVPSAPG